MIDVLRIAHLRIAPQEGNLEVGNCEGNLQHFTIVRMFPFLASLWSDALGVTAV